MTTRLKTTMRMFAALALLVLATGASAQSKTNKKLYCWNENGHRTCGDTLPPGATDLARTEFSARSGAKSGEVARALTPEERAAAAAAAHQAEIDAAAAAARERRDMAMVESYDTETDLRRTFNERITLLDLAIKSSVLGVTNLRASLVSQLNHASSIELDGKPVPPAILANIRKQHYELRRQQRILDRQRSDRSSLDDELSTALKRYRELKHPQDADVAPDTPTAPTGG